MHRLTKKESKVTNWHDFIRVVENERTYDGSSEDFKISKMDVKSALEELLKRYEDFTNDVSPKYWRTTGSHITYLKNILEEIERFEPISKEEKEIDWVKKARLGQYD